MIDFKSVIVARSDSRIPFVVYIFIQFSNYDYKGGCVRRLLTDKLMPGMIVARPIYNSDGRILLHSGIELDANYITRLSAMGIISVYVQDDLFGDVEIQDVVSEQTRIETMKTIKQNFSNLERKQRLNVHQVQGTVDRILDEVLQNANVLINLSDIRAFDDYTFGHSVNVCILSIITGISMGYQDTKLKELGIGALLHDIGKTMIDSSLLNKPGDLTHLEFQEVKCHTEYGFDILRQYNELSLLSAHIAFQHHERWDGQGYPRGLAAESIHEYARVVATVDVFDALMADRPYRPSYTLSQALHILKRMAGIYLDPSCVEALLVNIAVYPIGTIVVLNTGDIGIVMDVNREQPARPIVKIIYDMNQRRLAQPHEVDLSKMHNIAVAKTLTEEDIEKLRQGLRGSREDK